jgi:hypothetical protein
MCSPYRCWIDEFPKTWKASGISPKELFDKSIESVKKNQKITGKLLMTSYMPEESDRGFLEAKAICEASLLKTIKEGNKRTESNMIIFPIYASQSNEEAFDKYGRCDEELALKIVLKERSAKVTETDIQTHKRQYPLDWGEMFDNTGAGAIFDNVYLSRRLEELKTLDKEGINLFIEGNLVWKNSLYENYRRPIGKFCEVEFIPLTIQDKIKGEKGAFKFFFDPLKLEEALNFNKVISNKSARYDELGLLMPLPNTKGVLSVDPVDYKVSSDVRQGSKNAAHAGYIYDIEVDTKAGMAISNKILFEYNFRHNDPEKIYEDMLKAIIYTGFYTIIESNIGWMFTRLKKEGLQNFLLVRQNNNSITPWQPYAEYRGGNKRLSTEKEMINVYTRAIASYLANKKGENWASHIHSIELLEQLINFDTMDTKKFDLVVSLGYWRIGVESLELYYNEMTKFNQYHSGKLSVTDLDKMLSNF